MNPLSAPYSEAREAALELATRAEWLCWDLYRVHETNCVWPADDALNCITELRALHGNCWNSCQPLLEELASCHEGKLVDGWDGRYPSACEAVLSFASRVTEELLRL